MRNEDLDWRCYTLLSRREGPATLDELTRAAGASEEEVQASVSRLENALLVHREGDRLRTMAIQESLLACQIRYTNDLPIVLENGVIRVRRADDA